MIKDGTGNGFLARVNNINLLEVHSINVDEYVYESVHDGDSFRILGTTPIAAASEKTVLIVINNSDNLIGIDRITTSIQGESGKPVNIRIYLGYAVVTAGGSVANLINVNTTSSNTLTLTGTQNNPTIGGTDSKILDVYLESTSIDRELVNGGIVLGKSGSIRVTCQGAAGAAGTMNCNTSILIWTIEKTFYGLA
ncbi:MAG: hypothetical protein O8C67_05040 [Candidatus Methanoperedens sp.]|nr:hypothetical protein [Candidatus Methanoperedens sp.]